MSALWDEVVPMAAAAAAAGVPLVLDPVVVLGPPGVDKTWAVNQITSALALEGGTLMAESMGVNTPRSKIVIFTITWAFRRSRLPVLFGSTHPPGKCVRAAVRSRSSWSKTST